VPNSEPNHESITVPTWTAEHPRFSTRWSFKIPSVTSTIASGASSIRRITTDYVESYIPTFTGRWSDEPLVISNSPELLPTTSAPPRPRSRAHRKTPVQSAVLRLCPRLNEQDLSTVENGFWNGLVDDSAVAHESWVPRCHDVLHGRRACCNMRLRLLWEQNGPSHFEYHPSRCNYCDLSGVHYMAANGLLSLDDADPNTVNLRDRFDNCPLHFAAGRDLNSLPAIMALRQKGAELRAVNSASQNFLFALNPSGLGPELRDLMPLLGMISMWDNGFDFSHRDVHGQTFLHCLAAQCNTTSFTQVLVNVAKGFVPLSTFGMTVSSHWRLDFDLPDNRGITLASLSSSDELEYELRGYRVKYPSNWFDLLSSFDNVEFTKIVQYGSLFGPQFWNTYDCNGNTLLMHCVQLISTQSDSKRVRHTISHELPAGVRLDLVNRVGESIIFLAVRLGLASIVHALLQCGVSYQTENYAGRSVLDIGRDELWKARNLDSVDGMLMEARISLCLILMIDESFGRSLSADHRFGGGDSAGLSKCVSGTD
jgi:hypothetical protein